MKKYIKFDGSLDQNGQINKEKILPYYFNKDAQITIKFAGKNIPEKFKKSENKGVIIGKTISGAILQENLINSIENKSIKTDKGEIKFKEIYILEDKIILTLDKEFFCSLQLENTNNPKVVNELVTKFKKNIESMTTTDPNDKIGFKTLFGKDVLTYGEMTHIKTIAEDGIEKILKLFARDSEVKKNIKELIPFIKI